MRLACGMDITCRRHWLGKVSVVQGHGSLLRLLCCHWKHGQHRFSNQRTSSWSCHWPHKLSRRPDVCSSSRIYNRKAFCPNYGTDVSLARGKRQHDEGMLGRIATKAQCRHHPLAGQPRRARPGCSQACPSSPNRSCLYTLGPEAGILYILGALRIEEPYVPESL